MTSVDVNDVLKRTQSTANGSTTDFSFSFQVNNTNEIKVYEDSTLKTEGTHYDIVDSSAASGLNANGTGVVKFKTSPTDYTPANNKVITILSVMSIARASVYTSGGNITAASLEADFDKLHRVVGDFREVKSRTLIAPEYSPTDIDMTIPSKASRLGKILGFNSSTGNPEMFTYLINDNVTALDGLTAGTVLASKYVLVDANKDITGFRNITLSGELDAGSLDVSGDADIDGTLEADAITIGGVTLAETISDTVGAMVSSNTETGITVTYEDGDNTLDFVIGSTSITNAMLAGLIADSKLNTITTAGKVAIGALEIDGASDIGADLADADLIIVDDGAGGTEVKSELIRVKKYIYSSLSGDATTSDSGALTIANDAVESGMLNDNIISGQTAITSGLASTDELLFSDAGTIKRMDVSVLTDYYKDLTVTETNKTLTSPVLNTGVSGTAILDEDDLSTNSATQLATQQSIKAYVDAQTLSLIDEDNMSTDSASRPPSQQSVKAYIATQIATKDNSDEITEGSSNLYFTNARADARITNALIDEDDMSTNSATKIPSQQSVKAYVDAQKADMQFVLEDGDGTEVQITKDKEVKFVEGGGIDINWTDTSTGSDADPFDLTFTINAAQTDITSLLATDIKIGEDDQTKIDFETADTINFYAGNEKQIILTDGALTPGSNAIVDLGSSSLQFKDGYFDGTVEADAITIGGTTLAETISDTVGAMVGGNTETGITVTYEDSNNTLDFVIGAGSIVNSMLADDAVGADELASNAVVNASVASGAAIVDTKLATISTANKVALTALDIDGGADIGAAIVDADLFIIDDGGGGTNKKVAASRIKTYISAATSPTAADDIGEGDAAVTIATSTGNITLDAQGNDTDIIFKGTDGSSDTTFLTIDGSAAGAATFNDKIIATELDISGDIDVDGTANLDVVDIDGAVDIASTTTLNDDVTFTGANYNVVWDKSDNALEFGDNAKAKFGTGGDLEIYHKGGNNRIQAENGPIYFQSNDTTNGVSITKKNANETMAKFISDGAVELYHNDVKKIETTSAGVTVTGNVAVSSGNGIDFSATSDGSGSNQDEILEDYEDGEWNATLTPQTSGSVGMSNDGCQYVKVGQIVHVSGIVQVNSVSSPTGIMRMGGLPFACANKNDLGGGSLATINIQAGAVAPHTYGMWLQEGDSYADIFNFTTSEQPQSTASNNFSGNESIYFSMTYRTA